jgi:predicted aldo/keto reductase-like oxidoreductase
MKYVDFDKQKIKASRFGLGCMRFSRVKNDEGIEVIDEALAINIIRYAIDNGVNYIDTAYAYAGSEEVVGKALKDGYREKALLATKLPPWEIHSYDDFRVVFNTHLQRLQTDYIDIYLLHCMNRENWDNVKKHNVLGFMDELYAEGKIKFKGFSFHGTVEIFKEIVDAYDWDMCQIQLNYLDQDYQAGLEGLRYATSKGISVVIMEPLKGGMLSNVPDDIKSIMDKYPVKRSPSEWGFRWLYDMPEVSVILSGINTMDQLEENLRIFENSNINVLSKDERDLISKVVNEYRSRLKVGCTGCKYCMPCPSGVNIPEIFKLYNDTSLFGTFNFKALYSLIATGAGRDASKCIECGNCESLCPQGIEIIETVNYIAIEMASF